VHELSLAQEILRTVGAAAAENRIGRVTTIRVVVGKMSSVLPDSLIFSFDAIKGDFPAQTAGLFAGACLEIEERDVRATCGKCGHGFVLTRDLTCPRCGAADLALAGGAELYIESFDGE
jgi:hydrogenase nickel incorporation protein HypA/HybF